MPDKRSCRHLDGAFPRIRKTAEDHPVVICVLGAAAKAVGLRLWESGWTGYFVDPGAVANAIQGNEGALTGTHEPNMNCTSPQ